MSNRIEFNLQNEADEEMETKDHLVIQLSVYDTPKSVFLTEDRGTLGIHFEYPGKEPSEFKQGNDVVSFEVGRHSGKLITIKVRTAENDISKIKLLVDVLDHEISSLKRDNQKLNYRFIRSFLKKRGQELLATT